MAYSVKGDVLDATERTYLDQLTDDELGAEMVDRLIEVAIADADSLIDSYLATRYTVPLTTVPYIVRRASVVIAKYHLFMRRNWTLSEDSKYEYEKIIEWLKDVAGGNADVIGATTAASVSSSWQADTRYYTSTTLKSF